MYYCNYLPVYLSPRRNYDWIICVELLLSRLSENIFIQSEFYYNVCSKIENFILNK